MKPNRVSPAYVALLQEARAAQGELVLAADPGPDGLPLQVRTMRANVLAQLGLLQPVAPNDDHEPGVRFVLTPQGEALAAQI